MGGQPFGINVSPQQFSATTGLPSAFMNVSPAARARAAEINRGGGVGLGGEHLGKAPATAWPMVASSGGGALGTASGGGAVTAGRGGQVDPNSLFQLYVSKFRGSKLDGFVPRDGAQFGITKGTPEEWARLALATSKQESGLNANAAGGGLNQFENAKGDLARYGVRGADNDPNAQAQALVNQWTGSIPNDGVITGPGGGKRWGGASAYFGSIREGWNGRGIDIMKHMQWAGQIAAANAKSPTPSLANAPGTGGVTVSPIVGLPASVGLTPGTVQTGTVPAGTDPTGRADFMRLRGDAPIRSANDPRLTTISLGNQTWPVNKEAAPYFQGFLNDLSAAGAPHLSSSGGWVFRTKRTSGQLSTHSWGGAIDIAETGMGGTIDRPAAVPADFARWVQAHRDVYNQLEKKWHIYGGERFNDLGHYEWGGVPFSAEEAKALGLEGKTATSAASASQPAPPVTDLNPWPKDADVEDTRDTIARIQNDDRATLDKQQLAKATTSNIKINLRHRNAPPDVKVTASGDAFKGGSTERSNAPPAPAKPAEAPTKFKAGELEFG
jgi:hypothetical protein